MLSTNNFDIQNFKQYIVIRIAVAIHTNSFIQDAIASRKFSNVDALFYLILGVSSFGIC